MLSNAVEYSGEAISITNAQGIVQYINPAFTALTGYLPQDALNMSALELLNCPAQSEKEYQSMVADVTQGLMWCGNMVNQRKDGSYFPSSTCISPIKSKTGCITHYVTVQNDDSVTQQLHKQGIKEEKMKTLATAVGGIAHEFNNILTGIIGNAYLVKVKEEDAELQHKLESIEQLGQRAAGMVKQMLIYVGNDLQKHTYTQISLNRLLKAQVLRFNQKESVNYIFQKSADDMMVYGDAKALSEAMFQMLRNAKDAVENISVPQVVVNVSKLIEGKVQHQQMVDGVSYACIRVEDNGEAVPEDIRSSIFEPFFTIKDVGESTGLGLSAVYGIVKDHHGFVMLDKDYKAGCAFLLCLPLIEPDVPDFQGGGI